MKQILMMSALCMAVGVGPALAQDAPPPSEPAQAETAAPGETAAETAPVVAPPIAPRVLGQADAPVQIDLYSSFTCLDCAEWYLNVLPELMRDYIEPGRVRLIFHDLATVPAQPSVRAAMIGLCAAPGRFFDVAQSFFGGLRAAAEDVELVPRWYEDAVAASGLPAEDMEACANSEPVYEQVRAQMADPMVSRLTQLPGIVVNGELLEAPDPLLEASDLQTVTAAIIFALTTAAENAPSGAEPAPQPQL